VTTTAQALRTAEFEDLRQRHYNATLIERIDIHDDLARFRVRPDAGVPSFDPGQYVALGIGHWERRIDGAQPEVLPAKLATKLVRRAYSISCPMLDREQALLPCSECDFLEFYVTLIRQAEQPPALTPRLFAMAVGDRMFAHSRIVGTYTLAGINKDDTILMLGTGTGEAPHNAMAADLLRNGHTGPIVIATCARLLADFGYRREHDVLAKRYQNFTYLTYTTREPFNLDATTPGFVGLQRLQTVYSSGQLAADARIEISPQTTHVFLCGNPMMIGLRKPDAPPLAEPGMLQFLIADGFRSLHPVEHEKHDSSVSHPFHSPDPGPGIVRFEKYW
jgi:ferredoxin--NADP+ reductase